MSLQLIKHPHACTIHRGVKVLLFQVKCVQMQDLYTIALYNSVRSRDKLLI